MSITYKSDSDLASYYYRERTIEWKPSSQSNKSKLFDTKRLKAVASIVDEDCSIVEFLQSLNDYIRVDIYGKCGTFECDTDCLTFISKNYMFYFVIEPRICSNFVTQEFFQILPYDILPIILKRFDHDFYVPKSAFIDASSFPSFKSLSERLNYLASNPLEYGSYFEWKKYVSFSHEKINPIQSAICDLCILAHLIDIEKSILINKKIRQENHDVKDSNCYKVTISNLRSFNYQEEYSEENDISLFELILTQISAYIYSIFNK